MKEKQNNLTEGIARSNRSIVYCRTNLFANQKVLMIYKEIASGERQKRPYVKLTDPSQWCEIGRRGVQYDTTNSIQYHKKKYSDLNLSKPTVKNSYKDKLRKRQLEKSTLAQLPIQKQLRPLICMLNKNSLGL